jgi:hypothetical protein
MLSLNTNRESVIMNSELVVEGGLVGRRWFQRVIRNRLVEQLQKNGFAEIGKDANPLSFDRAKDLVNKVEDDDIMLAAQTVGALGDGAILSRLRDLMDWIIAHQDTIIMIVKMILALIFMFI